MPKKIQRYGEPVIKTTIEIPEDLYKEIKTTSFENNQTLKAFILEAVKEKLEKEDEGKGYYSKFLKVLSEVMKEKQAELIINNQCDKFGISPERLSPENKNYETFRSSILKHLGRYFGPETKEYVKNELEKIEKTGGI